MSKYVTPELTIEKYLTEDIISASGEIEPIAENDPYVDDKW